MRPQAVEAVYTGVHQGKAGFHGVIIQDIAGLEVVEAVNHQAGIPDKGRGVVGCDLVGQGDDLYLGIDSLQRVDCGKSLVRPDPVHSVEDLTVEVGKLHLPGVADPQRPHPGGSQENSYLLGQSLIDRDVLGLIPPRPCAFIVGDKSREERGHRAKLVDMQRFYRGLGVDENTAIVVRRSTTLVTWPSDLRSSPRSMTSCIIRPDTTSVERRVWQRRARPPTR